MKCTQLKMKQAEEKLARGNMYSWNSKVKASIKVLFLDIIPMPTEEICQTFNELRWERTVCLWQYFGLNVFTCLYISLSLKDKLMAYIDRITVQYASNSFL